ncbi:hypothetical protein Acr_18g0002390 [Actinidia rufa]|uniref:Uncharacterized protein n=1 Tax=Actinidia rufa TaxID=165716 RepID=A0A7J0G5L9_9ERIC|nr:hypothetical protein Acr_18g0002390 [Actinidia rufa]
MVYECNRAVDRKALWDELRVLHVTIAAEAWNLVGDFNSLGNVNEKVAMDSFDMYVTAEFNACVRDVEIDDLTTKGLFFTWSGKEEGMGYRKSKIDRAMVNHKWQDLLPRLEYYNDISKKVVEAKAELTRLKKLGSHSLDPNYVLLEKEALPKYLELSSAKESLKKQKARVRWLKLWDHNTNF